MSSSIAIPTSRRAASKAVARSPSSPSSSSYSSSHSDAPSTPPPKHASTHNRRPSLMSSALCQEESTVINIADPNSPPRLISYLASSQGFVWNPELFLPSYLDCDYVPLENRRDPVIEIHLTEEEISKMLPQ